MFETLNSCQSGSLVLFLHDFPDMLRPNECMMMYNELTDTYFTKAVSSDN